MDNNTRNVNILRTIIDRTNIDCGQYWTVVKDTVNYNARDKNEKALIDETKVDCGPRSGR